MTRVTIRPAADRDLDAIYDWIARDVPAAAARHVRRLVAAALSLRDFPERGRTRDDIGDGVRSLTMGRYRIFYRTDPASVDVVRVIDGARDIGGLLADKRMRRAGDKEHRSR